MSLLLAHLSDAHIGPLPRPQRRELVGKRLTGYINWTRARSHMHDMTVLRKIVEDIKARHPGHIAMTGDILNIGLPAEFPLARAWLETLGPGDRVSFVPGNHDAYVRGSLPDLARTFVPWTTSDGAASASYPYMRVRENVALIGLSSGVPTPLFIASGRLGRHQREACEALLDEAKTRGLVRVIMLHHPPFSRGTSIARGLNDAQSFQQMIARVGAELIVHGHNHRRAVSYIAGAVPVVGVVSASLARGMPSHRAGYNMFEIDGTTKSHRITASTRGILRGGSEIGDLGPIRL